MGFLSTFNKICLKEGNTRKVFYIQNVNFLWRRGLYTLTPSHLFHVSPPHISEIGNIRVVLQPVYHRTPRGILHGYCCFPLVVQSNTLYLSLIAWLEHWHADNSTIHTERYTIHKVCFNALNDTFQPRMKIRVQYCKIITGNKNIRQWKYTTKYNNYIDLTDYENLGASTVSVTIAIGQN